MKHISFIQHFWLFGFSYSFLLFVFFFFWVLLRVFSGAQEGLALHWRSHSLIMHTGFPSRVLFSPLAHCIITSFFRFSVCVLFLLRLLGLLLCTPQLGNGGNS